MTLSYPEIPIRAIFSLADYWPRLASDLETFLIRPLQYRHEYGTSKDCSERGIQLSLSAYAQEIAQRTTDADPNKTRCICLSVGLLFSEFGSVGMAAAENYMRERDIQFDSTQLKIAAIEHCITQAGRNITPQLDEALHAYFENRTDIPEVNIARYCQVKIAESRDLMKNGTPAGEAIASVIRLAAYTFSPASSLFPNIAPQTPIPAGVQKQVDIDLGEYISYYGLSDGVLKFLTV